MRTKVLFLLLLLIYSSLILTEVKADKEPNNTFSEAEILKDGSHNGNVSLNSGTDVDIYKVILHGNEKVNISIGLIEEGYLSIKVYNSKDEEFESLRTTLTKKGDHESISYKNRKDPRDIYIMISGNSAYRLNVKSSMNQVEGFISDNLGSSLIFVGVVLVILIVTVVVIWFFVKVIRLSFSHGFETKECEKGEKVGLADKKSRHDCMEILTDDDGVERMMKHEEAQIYKQRQDKNQFKLEQLEDHYYINLPGESPYRSVKGISTQKVKQNEI